MKRPNDLPAKHGAVDRLLRLREMKPADAPCPELEIIARVQDGGAPPELVQRAGEHLAACEQCARAVRLLSVTDPGEARTPRPVPVPRLAWAAGTLALMVLAVVITVWTVGPGERIPDAPFVVKGQADRMAVAVERGEARFTAREGDRLESGDRLGFFYSASRPGYLAFFDLDEAGETTVLFPAGARTSGWIDAGRERPLPDGGVVRGAEECEWLVAVFSDAPLDLQELEELLRRSVGERAGCRLVVTHRSARTVWVFPMRGVK